MIFLYFLESFEERTREATTKRGHHDGTNDSRKTTKEEF